MTENQPPLMDPERPLIIVVDDNQAVRQLVRRALVGVGYAVRDWANPEEALAHLHQSEEPVSLAVVDGVMPQMIGTTVADSLQELRPGLPVLLMSGHEAPMFQSFFGRPGRHFIAKPFVLEDFLSRVKTLVTA